MHVVAGRTLDIATLTEMATEKNGKYLIPFYEKLQTGKITEKGHGQWSTVNEFRLSI